MVVNLILFLSYTRYDDSTPYSFARATALVFCERDPLFVRRVGERLFKYIPRETGSGGLGVEEGLGNRQGRGTNMRDAYLAQA